MITKYKNITISKVKEEHLGDKKPTHYIKAGVKGSEDKQIIVGKLWTKESQYGKFLSGMMSDFYQNNDKAFEGFVIVNEQELDKLLSQKNDDIKPEDVPF